MRENRPSGSEGGAGENPLFLPLSPEGLMRSCLNGLVRILSFSSGWRVPDYVACQCLCMHLL
jgi:hypothetical protein